MALVQDLFGLWDDTAFESLFDIVINQAKRIRINNTCTEYFYYFLIRNYGICLTPGPRQNNNIYNFAGYNLITDW